jgi:hypothetical protein
MFRKGTLSLLAIALTACPTDGGSDDELGAGDTETETGTETDTDGGDEWGDTVADDESTDDTTSGGDCELGEYVANPQDPWMDDASGSVVYAIQQGASSPTHWLQAAFLSEEAFGDYSPCAEWLVGDADAGIDECNVYYSEGGLVDHDFRAEFVDIPVEGVTFDLGEGPTPVDFTPGDSLVPTWYRSSWATPPEEYPFGAVATMAIDFSELPDLEFDMPMSQDLLPIGPAFGSTMLSSDAMASWTWSNPGGSDPVELEINLGTSPSQSDWGELVRIHCELTDDGEFSFPAAWFDLARERLGPQIYAAVVLERTARGQEPLAGKTLYWESRNEVYLDVEIVD